MVRIRVDENSLSHPGTDLPLDFVRGCIAGDRRVIPLAAGAIKACRDLLDSAPDDAAVHHLAGIVAFIHGNREAAMAFFGAALAHDPNHRYAAEALADLVDADPHWPNTETYRAHFDAGGMSLRRYYAGSMQAAQAAGDDDAMDHWAQRISALNNPFIAQLQDIETCRRDGGAESPADDSACHYRIFDRYQGYWHALSEADVAANSISYAIIPDRRQLADIVLGEIGAETRTVLELGCFGGFNLQNVHDRLPAERRQAIDFVGIEPALAACRAGAEISPAVRFIHAGHEAFAAGELDLPDAIDICLVSRVLMILVPEMVDDILRHLAPRTRRLVICDDIANFGGGAPVVRGPMEFVILHPYADLLARAGFSDARRIPAEVPDRECSGFIVATGGAV